MGTESTRDDAFSDSMKAKIAQSMFNEMKAGALFTIIRDGFEGINNMNDQELSRYAMMYGLVDEDAGEDR